nr:hypothetical protein [uncultured Prevotella sp.]
MGMIGAAVGAAGSIFGGISATMAMNKMKANVEAQKRENQDWYDRRYNEDSTQRADAQKILTMTQESIKKNNKAAAASQAVMGGTDESTAAAKEANNKALAEATSTIAINGDKRKDAIEGQYRERDAALNQELNQIEKDKAAAIGQAVQGVSSAASSLPF